MLQRCSLVFAVVAVFAVVMTVVDAQPFPQAPRRTDKWVATWTASPHGPYPSGNPSAQPDLSTAFESATAGAVDQTFRLAIKPDLWGRTIRVRLSNVFGTAPVTFDGVFVGLQGAGGNVVPRIK